MRMMSLEAMRDAVGTDLGASDWQVIDQGMVDRFADLTNDHQFIHVDPRAAAATPLGGTVAHGFLTLSFLSALRPPDAPVVEGIRMGLNYGFEKVRFITPVRVGSRIRGRHRLAAVEARGPGQVLVTTEVTIEIEGVEKPALVALWLGLQITG